MCCHFMLALIPQAQGVNSYSPHFTSSDAEVSECEWLSVSICVCVWWMEGGGGCLQGSHQATGWAQERKQEPLKDQETQNAPWNNFYTSASPRAHHNEQRGIDSWSNDRDRHSNSIITTFTIKSTLNILYLHFRPGLGLSSRTFVLMCCITEQRTIRIENNHANTQINDKSINFKTW